VSHFYLQIDPLGKALATQAYQAILSFIKAKIARRLETGHVGI
jgi:hypothetical protein